MVSSSATGVIRPTRYNDGLCKRLSTLEVLMAAVADGRGLTLMAVKLPERDLDALRVLAREQERTLSGQVRLAVRAHLDAAERDAGEDAA